MGRSSWLAGLAAVLTWPLAAAPLPGAQPYPAALGKRLQAALAAEGADYVPRTEHVDAKGRPHYTNRLILEDSPYLRQHAHNPVDWYPWGDEAFAAAKRLNRPIFLSIGYSTCHWCHVMERESFDNPDIARLLNENYIAIKVDRERRPDVDEVYMRAVTMLTGRGGWPMTTLLTPEGKPFFGGTYFPPETFTQLLRRAATAWRDQHDALVEQAAEISAAVAQSLSAAAAARELDDELPAQAAARIVMAQDTEHGGFFGAPKFPNETSLLLLLDQAGRSGDAAARDAALKALDGMAAGGIHDHVGGGFHRYSTDARWLVPHFEKMLYNQANLARTYLEALRLTGDAHRARVARRILDYVIRDLSAPQGGFFSATDADSEGHEGRFFVWTPKQLEAVLGKRDAGWAAELFGVSAQGNFEGASILHYALEPAVFAQRREWSQTELFAWLDRIEQMLYEARREREPPLLDDKIVTAWNGMMISALAEGAALLGEPRYREAAEQAAAFFDKRMDGDPAALGRSYWRGRKGPDARLDDFASLAEAHVALFDLSGEPRHLTTARGLADTMIARLWDAEHGGFFLNTPGAEGLFAAPKSPEDGALPSGNAVAARVLAQLYRRTGKRVYRDHLDQTLAAFSAQIDRAPNAYAYTVLALAEHRDGEIGGLRYAADGRARVRATRTDAGAVITLQLADGWHVNADSVTMADLIPTRLSAWGENPGWQPGVDYPEPVRKPLGFADAPLNLFEGEVRIGVTLPPEAPHGPVDLKLRLQACNDELCLRPEDLRLQLGAAGDLVHAVARKSSR